MCMVLARVSLLFLIICHYSLYDSVSKFACCLFTKEAVLLVRLFTVIDTTYLTIKFFFPYGRYRLAGLPGEYQYKNITSAEINYCLVKDLIIWTQYEIQVASYNGAGLGAFSRPVTEYTLQGGKQIGPVGA